MATYFKSNRFLLFALFGVFIFAACKNEEAGGSQKKAILAMAGSVNDTLYKLYADSTSFLDLDSTKKEVFVANFAQNNILVLHGWSTKGDAFKTPPNIILNSYDTTAVTFGTGMYFGNIILAKKDIKTVQNLIRQRQAAYVLFVPKLVDGTHFGYDLLLTSDDPAAVPKKVMNTTTTGTSMNPSPPKNY